MADMDEDWGDETNNQQNDGWGDEENDKQKNDDWGDGGDFENQDENVNEEAAVDVQIANIFYEGEDMIRENPSVALSKFKQVVELAQANHSQLSDESRTSYFSSLVHITKLEYELGSFTDMVASYRILLSLIPKVTRNEASDAIDSVLNAVAHSADTGLLEQIYSITSQTVATMADTERLLFSVNMRLCRTYMNKNDVKNAQLVLDKLLKSCQTPDGLDDKKNKGSELLEIYALSIKLSSSAGDSMKMKELYERTKDLSAAVKDPRSQSVIRECWGMMWGDDGQWKLAYTEFYSAFTHYQEIGNRDRAKQCLMYVVIANMLSGGDSNPFDAREAKVYQNEPDIRAIVNLRTAYEKCEVQSFNDSLNEINKGNDKFIRTHLDSMIRDFQSRALIRIVKSYRRIRLEALAEKLKISASAVESIVVSLILDGEIAGRLDQVQGLLDLTQAIAGGTKKYNAMNNWQQTVSHLSHSLSNTQLPSQFVF